MIVIFFQCDTAIMLLYTLGLVLGGVLMWLLIKLSKEGEEKALLGDLSMSAVHTTVSNYSMHRLCHKRMRYEQDYAKRGRETIHMIKITSLRSVLLLAYIFLQYMVHVNSIVPILRYQ